MNAGGWIFRLVMTAACLGLLTGCVAISQNAAASQDVQAYMIVTANPEPSNTPFQPVSMDGSRPGELPATLLPTPTDTSTPLPSPTAEPTQTIQPTSTFLPTVPPLPSDTPLPTDLPVNTPTSLPPDTPIPQPSVERPQYAISALLDYAGHGLVVSEVVLYPNRTTYPLSNIVLGVNSNLWTGVFGLQTLAVNDQPTVNYSLSGQWLTVYLTEPLQPGQSIKIGIGYQLSLPYSSAKFENFGYTARQTNLIDWYPFVPPNIGGEWVLPAPYAYGENLVYDKADFRISLMFADPANAPVVAASAPASYENGALMYTLPNARNFTFSASQEYQLNTADANGVTIYSYSFGSNPNAAAMVLEMTRLSVITYTAAFGPYPHTSLTVCETDLNDGLETDGLYFLASSFYREFSGGVKNNLTTIAIHETAHQWWYGSVANNQAVEPWLDEALATYSEHVFFENNYPDLLQWWWNFRVYSHGAVSGWVDSKVYDTSSFSTYVTSVYFNGAVFLQSLRDRIGNQVFLEFIRDYYTRNNGRIATAADFFSILDLHTSVDTSDLVNANFNYR